MPFRKKSKKRTKLTLGKINKKVNSLMTAVERKFRSGYKSYTGVDSVGTYQDLNIPYIAEGTNVNQRVGAKIVLKSIQIKGQMLVGAGVAPDAYNQMRIILVKYRTHGNSSANANDKIALSDLLQHASNASYSSETRMNSLYKKQSQFQFKILYDKVHLLGWHLGVDGSTTTPHPKRFRINVNCKDAIIEYKDNGEPAKDTYAMLYFSDSGTANNPSISYTWRINFVDL